MTSRDVVMVADAVCDLGGHAALCGASLRVAAGETLLLRGPNGAGKTTLLRLIAGRIAITRGRVEVFGHDLTHHRRAVRGRVGYVGHETGLYDDLTVQDNLSFRAAAFGTTKQQVRDICDTVGLDTRLLSVPAKALSAGQRKKAALVGLALSASPLWLLDEPHASLDSASADGCDALLTAARQNGTTIVFASHELDRSTKLATREVLVDDGLVSPC